MNTQTKQYIAQELKALADKTSGVRLANRAGVSNATISQMINGNWSLIKDEMWRKVQTTLRIDLNWRHADTSNYNYLMTLLSGCQERSLSIGIAYDAGHSKSHTYKQYERLNENVIYVECANYWTRKDYARALANAAGIKVNGTYGETIERFLDHLRSLDRPLVIIDQADKLSDSQLDLFMDFYNQTEGYCGFVLSGVPALSKRIDRGVQRDRIGYKETFSRLGSKFITLKRTTLEDVAAVCKANGIDDEDTIIHIFTESDGDMRRVRRSVEREWLIKSKAA